MVVAQTGECSLFMIVSQKLCGLIGKPKVQSTLDHGFLRVLTPSDLVLMDDMDGFSVARISGHQHLSI